MTVFLTKPNSEAMFSVTDNLLAQSVKNLKDLVFKFNGHSPQDLRLTFNGKVLDETKTFISLAIHNYATVVVVDGLVSSIEAYGLHADQFDSRGDRRFDKTVATAIFTHGG